MAQIESTHELARNVALSFDADHWERADGTIVIAGLTQAEFDEELAALVSKGVQPARRPRSMAAYNKLQSEA